MLGDFNQIWNNSEKLGGHPRDEDTFCAFNPTLDICDILELKHYSNKFCWSGNRSLIRDGIQTIELIQYQALANSEWLASYPASTSEFLEPVESDHRPLIVTICSEQ